MKKALSGLLILMWILTIGGCTKVLNSQQQIMQRDTTKAQVSKDFGRPAEKRQSEETEEWLYNYGAGSANSNFETNTVTQFSQFSSYVKFTFDGNGNVTKWDSHGVNKEVRQKNTSGTIVLVVGLVGILIGLLALGSSAARGDLGGY